jgi:prevent-host-death family protein
VLKPLTEHERYDLVLGIAGQLYRVQCKSGSRKGEVIHVRVRSSYRSPTKGYIVKTYNGEQVDLVAIYCGELDRCFLLPVDLFEDRSTVYLRLGRTRNNQRAALNWATDYDFYGAVAQLEERRAGSAKVRGSSPLSSTLDLLDLESPVGMDRFYSRLAHYVRYAEVGGEVLVTRRGKPVARLVAADLKL